MLDEFKRLLSANDDVDEASIKQTAQQLLTRQFLHRERPIHRKHYQNVVRFQRFYRNLFDVLNHTLVVNESKGYVGLVPEDFVLRMKLEETLILLTLRFVYDQEVGQFNVDENGCVSLMIDEFEDRYQHFAKRELPRSAGTFNDILKTFADRGVISVDQEESELKMLQIMILPTIAEVLTGAAIERMAGYLMANNVPVTVEEESEDTK